MRAAILLSLAVTAIATAATAEHEVPDLPDGWFTGFNHANGTTTLVFHDSGQEINFKPRAAPEVALSKRAASTSCWDSFPKLPTAGTDAGIQAWRDVTQQALVYVGGGNGGGGCSDLEYPPYIGINSGGVYVYFCYNSNNNAHDSADFDDVQFATLNMDQQCGGYVPGFYQWDSPSLFGKCASGTSVCLGNTNNHFVGGGIS